MKKLLMLGTSYGTCLMLEYAKSKGVYTIVTDYNEPEHSPGKQISDEYWMLNTGDLDALEKKCREEGVNAVVCGISEFNLEMCMELCRRLALPCYCTPEAWHYSHDKVDYKALATSLGAPLADDYFLSDPPTREELDKVKYPVVVKPIDLSCNRGISYVYNEEELFKAMDYARSMSSSRKLVVERMLHGEEWYGTYALADGEVHLLALCAMYAQPGYPKFCYSITTTVSNHVEDFCREINPHIENVIKGTGCREGYAWTQAMRDEDGHFYIIEMGYRLDGDMMYVPFKELLGFDVTAWIVDYALGERNDPALLPPSQAKAFTRTANSYMLWTDDKGGTIASIEGLDEVKSWPGVTVDSLAAPGDSIRPYGPLGCILFTTENVEDMIEMIRKINDTVRITNTDGDDVLIYYTDFDYLRQMYREGLEGK